MTRKLMTALILVPLAILLIAFAVANRQRVIVSFDPFDAAHPALAYPVPLFALMVAALLAGVLIGGTAAWMRQAKWRRAARLAQGQANALSSELERLKERAGAADREQPAARYATRLSIPPPAA